MSGSRYLAVDLGAESGRVISGVLDGRRVTLSEVHRFSNPPVRTPDGLHWDVLRLYAEVLNGLRAAARADGGAIVSIGVDAWGIDYGLLDAAGRLLGNPYHYRDARTEGLREESFQLVSPAEQYARTGIAQMAINTLYQLMAQRRHEDRSLDLARSLLMIPDLLHYWLSGERTNEYTNATTTGALGVDGAWASDLLARLDVPSQMLLPPTGPGTTLGRLRLDVQRECELGPVPVILPATHDTASAVVAVPVESPSLHGHNGAPSPAGHAYISSGTWSLLGLELDRAVVSEEARLARFTNEGGVAGTYRFLTNIMGLWLVQECRRAWARGGQEWSYDELTARAATVPSPGVAIDVDDPALLRPSDMPAALLDQITRSGQPLPDDPVVLVRAVLEGLALAYRMALERAEQLTGRRVHTVHVVGGGARNGLLCRLTAAACGRPVVAGPIEATALGNVLVQAMGRGEVASLAEAHAIAHASTELQVYEPGDVSYWDELYARLQQHTGR